MLPHSNGSTRIRFVGCPAFPRRPLFSNRVRPPGGDSESGVNGCSLDLAMTSRSSNASQRWTSARPRWCVVSGCRGGNAASTRWPGSQPVRIRPTGWAAFRGRCVMKRRRRISQGRFASIRPTGPRCGTGPAGRPVAAALNCLESVGGHRGELLLAGGRAATSSGPVPERSSWCRSLCPSD